VTERDQVHLEYILAAHAYTQTDLQRVWEIVRDHLPAL
jgi:uncharacterized protein with HEPN domain